MSRYLKFLMILFAAILSSFSVGTAHTQYVDYAFVVFETTVTRQGVETSDKNPEERRFYVSNVIEFSERDASIFRNAGKLADDYFIKTVVDPMKAKGILYKYYDDAIRINNNSVLQPKDRAEAEELRAKYLLELKEQNANVFTFTWTRSEKTNGLESSLPILFYHGPEQPLYGASEVKPGAPRDVQTPINPPQKKRPQRN